MVDLGVKIVNDVAALRAKTCSYLTDRNDEDKKVKNTKNCVLKQKLKFEDYKHYLETLFRNSSIWKQNKPFKKKLNVYNL